MESGHVRSINELGEHHVNISTSVKLHLLNTWHSLNATTEQTRETQLVSLYDALGFQRVIARYNVVSRLYETGPCCIRLCYSRDKQTNLTP